MLLLQELPEIGAEEVARTFCSQVRVEDSNSLAELVSVFN